METDVTDVLPCDEQLRSSLCCDDKEKLRRRLAMLQREYLRTAQRLQRAERMDAVRTHVRSKITQHNQDQDNPETTLGNSQGEGPEDSDSSNRSQVIRFQLPSDARCPQTPDVSYDVSRGHRPSAAMRLRSRRSRLRWERRSVEAGRITETSEDGIESPQTEAEEEKIEPEVVNESEELFSDSQRTGDMGGKEVEECQERRGKESELSDEGEKHSIVLTLEGCEEAEARDCREIRVGTGEDGGICGGGDETRTTRKENSEQNEHEKMEKDKRDRKDDPVKGDGKRFLDSCTLVEGLLFPAEYYVRTTRRMTQSQSQPDMQAVILSQLSAARPQRSRGRKSVLNTASDDAPGERTDTESASPSIHPPEPSPAQTSGFPVDPSQSSSETDGSRSEMNVISSPTVCCNRPGRGKGRKRGRARPSMPRSPDASHLGLGPSPAGTPVPPAPPAPQRSSGSKEAQLDQGNVFPIFLKSNISNDSCTRMNRRTRRWQSLLLPPSPSAPACPVPRRSLSELLGDLMNSDVQQDFHLPDEQFASLKLHKLQRVAVESEVEGFTSPYDTRQRRRLSGRCTDPVMPLPLPLSLTPTVTESPRVANHTLADQSPADVSLDAPEPPEGRQTRTSSTQPRERSADVGQCKELGTVVLTSCNISSVLTSNTDKPAGNIEDNPTTQPASEEQTDCVEHSCGKHRAEDQATTKTHVTAGANWNHTEAPGDSATDSKAPREHMSPNGGESVELKRPVNSQLLLSPSASCPFVTPHPVSSAHPSSPSLPSLGPTPCPAFPPASSPSAPPHSPSTQAGRPPPASPSTQDSSPSKPRQSADAHPSSTQAQDSVGPVNRGVDGRVKDHVLRPVQTMKVPAGSCLVDACCLPRHSGGLCVAAAGKWAVCVWSQTPASTWSLTHTWTFENPVINVFSIPDAPELVCVTLGQLEIREVRVLSCSSLSPVLIHHGVVQAVVGVSTSRLVLSSHAATGSTLQVFTLSDSVSTPTPQHLVPPGVCIGALAAVDGLPDALIGTDQCGHVFIWNLKTGQLLQTVVLREDFSHTACVRGYSQCGVLFILLQHQLLSSPEEDEKEATAEDPMTSQEQKEAEKRKTPFFSLVAVNPLSGKSVLAAKLYPPKGWSGRLCEADVHGSSVLGLSQSGCVCVWELVGRRDPRMMWPPETEGWQLARWGGADVLLIGHSNGNVSLHCYARGSVDC